MQTPIEQVFSKEWFEKHKPKILWILNHSSYFRKDLGIQECDLPNGEKITDITPNSFSYGDRPFMKDGKLFIERTTDFRTHDKFAKRLYYGFYPVWNLAHKFDMSVANRWVPAMNLGFDTLTAYPAAGANSPCDGYVSRYVSAGEVWGTIIAGEGTDVSVTGTVEYYTLANAHSSTSGRWVQLNRFIAMFNTSSITSGGVISAATLSLYGESKKDDSALNSPNLDIYLATPANTNNLETSDYLQIGSTSQTGSPIAYSSYSTTGYNDFAFNATGIGNISKTGISKFGTKNANYDAANSSPTWGGNIQFNLRGYTADETGTTKDPKLVVTYSIPVAFIPKVVIM